MANVPDKLKAIIDYKHDEVAALKQWHANVRLTDVFATGILS